MGNRHRAQSEVIGVVILTGVVVITVTTAGVLAIAHYTQTASDDTPLFDCAIEYTDDNVTITHAGGESVDSDSLSVILRNDSGQTRVAFGEKVGPRFRTGDVAQFGDIGTETEVLVATDRAVVCENTVLRTDTP